MRLPMALSNTTTLAMQEYKTIKFPEMNVTYGYLVKKSFDELQNDLNNISWEDVNLYESIFLKKISNAENIQLNSSRHKTTLNINEDIVKKLEVLRNLFKDIFCTERIYLPFVLKLIFLATLMKLDDKLPLVKKK